MTSGKLSPHSSGGAGPGSAVVMTPMIDGGLLAGLFVAVSEMCYWIVGIFHEVHIFAFFCA